MFSHMNTFLLVYTFVVVKAALTGFMSVLDDDLKTKEHLQKYLDAIV